jgi:hypothetical protein
MLVRADLLLVPYQKEQAEEEKDKASSLFNISFYRQLLLPASSLSHVITDTLSSPTSCLAMCAAVALQHGYHASPFSSAHMLTFTRVLDLYTYTDRWLLSALGNGSREDILMRGTCVPWAM